MTPRERLLCVLKRGTPDRVPYCEVGISDQVLRGLSDTEEEGDAKSGIDAMDARGSSQEEAISRTLGRDHLCYRVQPPIMAVRQSGADGIPFYADGQLRTRADIERFELPDPLGEELWADAPAFLADAGDRATCVVTRAGLSPVYLSMGLERFSIALHEEPSLVEALTERYTTWAAAIARRASELGFDFIWTADDLAFKTGPFLSPQMFRERFLPHLRRVADAVSIPWVFHSDGDLSLLLDDLIEIGVTAFNPIEPEAMDILQVKKRWGDRLCLIGNVSVHLLASGSPDQVRAEVRRLLRSVAPGGGYALASGNSLASYCKPENVRAMLETLRQYGDYPLDAGT